VLAKVSQCEPQRRARSPYLICGFIFASVALLPLPVSADYPFDLPLSEIIVSGQNGIGPGEVNVSVRVDHLSGSQLWVNLHARLENSEGVVFWTQSSNLTVLQNSNLRVNLSLGVVPTGIHQFRLSLSNHSDPNASSIGDSISRVVPIHRLFPADAKILDIDRWKIEWRDHANGSTSPNATPTEGEIGIIAPRLINLGEVSTNISWNVSLFNDDRWWNDSGILYLSGGEANLTSSLQSDELIEGPLIANVSIAGSAVPNGSANLLRSWVVSPRPSPILNLTANWVNLSEDEPKMFVEIENSGAVSWNGTLSCGTPDFESFRGFISIADNSIFNISVESYGRAGRWTCSIESNISISSSSVLNTTLDLQRPSAIWELMSEPRISDGSRHAGDSLAVRAIVRNNGTLAGSIHLEIKVGLTVVSSGPSLRLGANEEGLIESFFVIAGEGSQSFTWALVASDGWINGSRTGAIAYVAEPLQKLSLLSVDVSRTAQGGSYVQISLNLSEGASRSIDLKVGLLDGSYLVNEALLLSPGHSLLIYDLTAPSSKTTLRVFVSPVGWGASNLSNSSHLSTDAVLTAIGSELVMSAGLSDTTAIASSGQVLGLSVTLRNDGSAPSPSGRLVITRDVDGFRLAEVETPLLDPGASKIIEFNLAPWPDNQGHVATVRWTVDETVVASSSVAFISAQSSDAEVSGMVQGSAIGALGAIVLLAVIRIAMAARSSNSDSLILSSERKMTSDERIEISCPECPQRLRVPSDYSGRVRCAACGEVFPVELNVTTLSEVNEDDVDNTDDLQDESPPDMLREDISSSKDTLESVSSKHDVVRCPTCQQALRVPIDRRPVTARCPKCETRFQATYER